VIKAKCIYVDIGGSNTKIYLHLSPKTVKLHHAVKTPRSEPKLYSLIEQILSNYECDHAYIGIPGPAYKGCERVYMPPLEYSVNINRMKRLTSVRMIVENDCSLLQRLLRCMHGQKIYSNEARANSNFNNICVSVGTSLGLNVALSSATSISIEIAHLSALSILHSSTLPFGQRDYKMADGCKVSDLVNSRSIIDALDKSDIPDLKTRSSLPSLIGKLLFGSCNHGAILFGMRRYSVAIVSGIPWYMHSLIVSMSEELRSYLPDMTSISLYNQDHLNIIKSD